MRAHPARRDIHVSWPAGRWNREARAHDDHQSRLDTIDKAVTAASFRGPHV